jgi:[protein-PII] uridylyltransferase
MILLKHEEPHLTSQRVQTRLFSELRPSHKRFEQLIEIDNESSNEYTLFEIILQDRIGLLYDITCQFSRFDVEIITAVINTEDKIAHDVFYLQQGGQKLDAASILNLLSAVYSQEIEPQVTKIET